MAIKTVFLLVVAIVVASAENLRVDLPEGAVSDIENLAASLGLEHHGRELGPFCDRVIDVILANVPPEILPPFEFDCGCSINFGKKFIDFNCELIDPLCVGIESELCIAGHAQANLTFAEQVALEVDLCADIEGSLPLPTDLPFELPEINIPDTCLALATCEDQGLRGLMRFCECSVMMGGEECTSCSICEDGKSVTLDCREINEFFAFECIGLDTFLPPDMQ